MEPIMSDAPVGSRKAHGGGIEVSQAPSQEEETTNLFATPAPGQAGRGNGGSGERHRRPMELDDMDEIRVHESAPAFDEAARAKPVLLNRATVEMHDLASASPVLSSPRQSADGLLRSAISQQRQLERDFSLMEEEDEDMGDEGRPDDIEAGASDAPGVHQAHHRPKFRLNLQLLDFQSIKRCLPPALPLPRMTPPSEGRAQFPAS